MNANDFTSKLKEYLPEEVALARRGYYFTRKLYGELRQSEKKHLSKKEIEQRLNHALGTAIIVADLQLDITSILATLFHDVMENGTKEIEEKIRDEFGDEVAKLSSNVAQLSNVIQVTREENYRQKRSQAEILRKMFVAMSEDVRVILIKMSGRLQRMRQITLLSPERRLTFAQETMNIFAPLAHQLGISRLKWELENLAFEYLEPEKYREIVHFVGMRRAKREEYIEQVSNIIRKELEKAGIKANVSGRPKNIYSIYQKKEKYATQGKSLNDIYDLFALRVILDKTPRSLSEKEAENGKKEEAECYHTLGVIHNLWHPLPSQFDDYIANPKKSGYRSLHTTVIGTENNPLEIQIRTSEMHREAEYGIAAHWRYKKTDREDKGFEKKIARLRQTMEKYQQDAFSLFEDDLKIDAFQDRVFVYTPKGEIKEFPQGATPLDFAYSVHTDLGHRCVGAKVNDKLVSLSYKLQNGDSVKILATKSERGPSRDWLDSDYTKTSNARVKIRQWFKKQEREENIKQGRDLLEKELRRLGVSFKSQEEIAKLFEFENLDDFLEALGCGDISPAQIATKVLTPQVERPKLPVKRLKQSSIQQSCPAVKVLGVDGLLTYAAKCCNPVPGDEIIGFVTRTRGIGIHRKDCPNIIYEDEKERLIEVEWDLHELPLYPVIIQIEGWDRIGLLRDITATISEKKMNISSINSFIPESGIICFSLAIEIKDIGELSRLLSKIEQVRGVISAVRSENFQESK
jgi:GTP pyrophosphokinase